MLLQDGNLPQRRAPGTTCRHGSLQHKVLAQVHHLQCPQLWPPASDKKLCCRMAICHRVEGPWHHLPIGDTARVFAALDVIDGNTLVVTVRP